MVKDGTAVFHCYYKVDLISRKKRMKKFFNNFIWFIISHGFYVISFFVLLTLSAASIEDMLTGIVNWISHVSEILWFFFDIFQIWSNFVKIFFNWVFFLFLSPSHSKLPKLIGLQQFSPSFSNSKRFLNLWLFCLWLLHLFNLKRFLI